MSNRTTPWLKVYADIFSNKKTAALANSVARGDVHKVGGHLIALWHWAMEYAPDGDLSYLSDRAIAQAAGWQKPAKPFVAALTAAGFLEDHRLHDWDFYVLGLVNRRKKDAARKRAEYEAKRTTSAGDSEGDSSGSPQPQSQSESERVRPSLREREELTDPTLPSFLEERLADVVRILAQSKHAKAFGKRSDLASVLLRHPDKDAVQTAEAIAERMAGKIANGPAFFESWLANAVGIEPPAPELTDDEIRHGYMQPGDVCDRDGCEVCATQASAAR